MILQTNCPNCGAEFDANLPDDSLPEVEALDGHLLCQACADQAEQKQLAQLREDD